MGFLKPLIAALLFAQGAAAATPSPSPTPVPNQTEADFKALREAEAKLCHSTAEYVKTLKFLRETKEFTFQEAVSRRIADDVSKGCDGAAERFAVVLTLLKNVGLSEQRCLKMALEFAVQPPDVQKNFVEIFTNAFLTEFFDFEYSHALKLAIELSKDYKGDPATAREDFLQLVRFCKQTKTLDLPMSLCADYMAKIAKSSQYYNTGVAKPFNELFSTLRERKDLTFDIKTTLQVAHDVLKNGPNAPQNFFEAYEFSRKEMDFDKKRALDFALKLAGRSYVGSSAPIMQFPKPAPEIKR